MNHLGNKKQFPSPGKNFTLNSISEGGIALSNRIMVRITNKMNKVFGGKQFYCHANSGVIYFNQAKGGDTTKTRGIEIREIRNDVVRQMRDEMYK